MRVMSSDSRVSALYEVAELSVYMHSTKTSEGQAFIDTERIQQGYFIGSISYKCLSKTPLNQL